MQTYKIASRSIARHTAEQSRKLGLLAVAARITAGVGAAMAAIGALFADKTWGPPLGIAGAVIAALSGGVLFFVEDNASAALAVAYDALETAETRETDFITAVGYWRGEFNRLSHYQAAREVFRGAFEDIAGDEKTPVMADCFQRIFTQSKKQLLLAHGFKMEEHYTICLFQLNTPDGVEDLECVAHLRSIDCPASEARHWKRGEGAGGAVLVHKHEVVIPDLLAPQLGSYYAPGQVKSYDAERYRSIVAQPVWQDENQGTLWGVLCATSSKPNHFDLKDRTFVEVTRSLAGMASLAVKIIGAKKPPSGPLMA